MRLRHVAVLTVAILALASCGSDTTPEDPGPTGTVPTGELTVFAAASLREAFTTIGASFERTYPAVKIRFDFGPSSGLARSISSGAPVDVFASAAPANMDPLVRSGLATTPTIFARNTMEIAVPPRNPGRVTRLADLASPRVKVALCQPQVPCGAVAAAVLEAASLKVTPVTEEVDVTSVLTKVRLGEVDAGIVYLTDVLAAGAAVRGVTIPTAMNASTDYPIAALQKAPNTVAARAFVAYVLSEKGRQALRASGFTEP